MIINVDISTVGQQQEEAEELPLLEESFKELSEMSASAINQKYSIYRSNYSSGVTLSHCVCVM